jgi:hypothetical protein
MRSHSLVQVLVWSQSSQICRDYIQILALGSLGEIARKKEEEGLHFHVEHLDHEVSEKQTFVMQQDIPALC